MKRTLISLAVKAVCSLPPPQPIRWCTHCRKDDHTDAECWSTRLVQFGEAMKFGQRWGGWRWHA